MNPRKILLTIFFVPFLRGSLNTVDLPARNESQQSAGQEVLCARPMRSSPRVQVWLHGSLEHPAMALLKLCKPCTQHRSWS